MLKFFNTLSRRKEAFAPIEAGVVGLYTCGPTVYDYAHIGNFRTYVFQDVLRRWLEYRGFRVKQVMNLTDVDDKTIRGAKKQGIPLKDYTAKYIEAFFEDLQALNIEKAEHYPKATEHVPDMVRLVQTLIKKGYAYRGRDGSIYYDIKKFKEYGKLSKIRKEELKVGARVKVDEYSKEEARDFALWKAWDKEDGDVFWETPLGKGRPGWHIECSAMAMRYLGETLDIHSGGVDLVFPHHENETAQSEAATGKPFARYWMHSEYLQVEGRKMAKSLGNFYALRDLLEKGYAPRAIRYLLLSTHYRQQLNFTFAGLDAAASTVQRLQNFMSRLREADGEGAGGEAQRLIDEAKKGFENAMDDDLDINTALSSLFSFIREANRLIEQDKLSRAEAEQAASMMRDFDKVLGILSPEEEKEEALPPEIKWLIEEREKAREARDWKKADEIRSRLREMGFVLEDTAKGAKWKREK